MNAKKCCHVRYQPSQYFFHIKSVNRSLALPKLSCSICFFVRVCVIRLWPAAMRLVRASVLYNSQITRLYTYRVFDLKLFLFTQMF